MMWCWCCRVVDDDEILNEDGGFGAGAWLCIGGQKVGIDCFNV